MTARAALAALVLAIAASAQDAPREAKAPPGFRARAGAPAAFRPRVGALAVLSSGSLAVGTLDPTGAVYLVALPMDKTVDGEAAHVTRAGAGFDRPCAIASSHVVCHVLSHPEVTTLDIRADLQGAMMTSRYATRCAAWPADRQAPAGMAMVRNRLYVALAPIDRSASGAGIVLEVHADTGKHREVATGLDLPGEVAAGPHDQVVLVERTGDAPARLVVLAPDPTSDGPTRRAVAWRGVRPEVRIASLAAFAGVVHRGQLVATDERSGRLWRIALEGEDGARQGALMPYGETDAPAGCRIACGPACRIHLGDPAGGPPGLLEPLVADPFEIALARATGPQELEVELTERLADGFEPSARSWTVRGADGGTIEVVTARTVGDRRIALGLAAPLARPCVVSIELTEPLADHRGVACATPWVELFVGE